MRVTAILGPAFALLRAVVPWTDGPSYHATIDTERPERHFFHVELQLEGYDEEALELVLPSWTPGSYKIRDYAQNLEGFEVSTSDGRALPFEKVAKNVWRVENPGSLRIRYDAYAHEASVRTSWLDSEQAFLMPGTVLPFVRGHLGDPVDLEVRVPEHWRIDTTLPALGPRSFRAPDYDRLVDRPLQMGTQEVFEFEVDGTRFALVCTGPREFDGDRLVADLRPVVAAAGAIFGGFPFERYLFLVRFGTGDGGLEHADCTALMSSGLRFGSQQGWNGFLGLCAHEFFHAWNVKRIHDRVLGPFDYEREVYSRLLWFHEGFTNYYANQLLRRAGKIDEAEYLRRCERVVADYFARPGRHVQSLVDSSFDSWIKYYQTNETTRNSTVNYYSQGEAVALCLDLLLRANSQGRRSLDDVLRHLDRSFAAEGRGITEQDLAAAFEQEGGEAAARFWRDHVIGTKELDFRPWTFGAGLELGIEEQGGANANSAPAESAAEPWKLAPLPDLGLGLRTEGRSLVVDTVDRDGAAWEAGLDLGDELLAVGPRRIEPTLWEPLLRQHLAGGSLVLTVARQGRLFDLELALDRPRRSYSLKRAQEPSEEAARVQRGWLSLPEPEPATPAAESSAESSPETKEPPATESATGGSAGEDGTRETQLPPSARSSAAAPPTTGSVSTV